jgi:hypothetical protein
MQDRVPTQNPRAASEEVDIREVFAAIGNFFRRIGNSFILFLIQLRKATKKYAWLIVACMLTGAAIGYIGYVSFQPYYASELALSSRYYSSEMLKSAINELDQLAAEDNHGILANKLNITPEQASVIRSFTALSATTTAEIIEVEELLRPLTTNDQVTEEQLDELRERLVAEFGSFKIVATVYDLSVLDPLEQGIVTYLTDNDYIRRRVAVEQENLLVFRDKLRKDQDQLNQLKTLQAEAYKRLAETGQSGSNNVIFGTPETTNAPLNVYVQDMEFARELIKTNEKLELNRGLEVVSSFTPYGRPASLTLSGQLILGALIGLGVAYLIIILIGINQALNRYEEKYAASKTKAMA